MLLLPSKWIHLLGEGHFKRRCAPLRRRTGQQAASSSRPILCRALALTRAVWSRACPRTRQCSFAKYARRGGNACATIATNTPKNFSVSVFLSPQIVFSFSFFAEERLNRPAPPGKACCCGCKKDASNSAHTCSITGKKVMGYCYQGEGQGPCKGCG